MTVDPRAPCIIGVAQQTVARGDGPAPEPLAQWAGVCRAAAQDSAARLDVLEAVEGLSVTYCHSWPYLDPVGHLSAELGIAPSYRKYSGIGGTMGQQLVVDAATRIVGGELDVSLVCGAEALYTVRHYARAGEAPPWRFRDPDAPPLPIGDRPWGEFESGLLSNGPSNFAPWDIVRRARLGADPDDYRRQLGELLAPMTAQAAGNPHAWFPRTLDANTIITATPENRMVAYPYTKLMCAVMDVDMAAALVVASHGAAERLGVPRDRRVYLRSWCSAEDPLGIARRSELWRSAAMEAAAAEALRRAGAGIDEVAHLDLYSCFGCSINFARDALGVTGRPGDRLTVTGGLPYAGGPASNYMTHSIAAMTEVLRGDPAALGLVSGVGMMMEKHAFSIYSTDPPSSLPAPPTEAEIQARLDALPTARIVEGYEGPGTIATYSVVHDGDGEPQFGVAMCDVNGGRTYARFDDPELMAAAEREEVVGFKVDLTPATHSSIIRS